MALRIYEDISGNFITNPAQHVSDGIVKGRDGAQLTLSNVWAVPSGNGLTLMPNQLTGAWASATGKLRQSDFLVTAGKWDEIASRSATDYILASKGAAIEPLKTRQDFPENQGLFVEFFAYGTPKSTIQDLAIIHFGQNFRLRVHSNGLCDLEDLRPEAEQQYLAQNAALTPGGRTLLGEWVSILILPWRRGRILFVSHLGNWFEAAVGERADGSNTYASRRTPGQDVYHIVTEKGQATLDLSQPKAAGTSTVTPLRAFGTINPLSFPASGFVKSPIITLQYAVTQAPTQSYVDAEQQDGATAALVLTDGAGNPLSPTTGAPASELEYQVNLATPDPHVTPVVYGVHVDFDRQTGTRTFSTNALGSPVEARLTLSRQRDQKSFSFTLINEDEEWTSLKDFWNRVIEARLETDSVDSTPTVIFRGLTDPPDFLDGVGSRITIPCSGLRKRLRSHLLNDAKSYDGMLDTAAVRAILHEAGIDDSEMVIDDANGTPLDSADPGDDPLWKPTSGISADEFIQHICDTFSGWIFDDIGGTYYYVPKEYFSASAVAGNDGIPEVFMEAPIDDLTGEPVTGVRGPNATVLVALKDSVRQAAQEEPRANDIWVLGRDPDSGEILAAHYVDQGSIQNETIDGTNNLNFVGERRLFIYASASITTLAMAERACAVFANRLTQPVRPVSFRLPDYQWQALPLEGPIYLHNYGYALITAVDANLNVDRMRVTEYTCELL